MKLIKQILNLSLLTALFTPIVLLAAQPTIDKIVLIVFENVSEEDTIKQPTFKEIALKSAYFSDFHAVARPSLPNYIAMTAGSTFGITSDHKIDLDKTSLVNLLDNKKLSWKVYAENYPEDKGCFLEDHSDDGLYARNHNPFISYTYVSQNPSRCKQIVNAQAHFTQDIAQNKLPNFSLYIPNIINNGHRNGIADAEKWLKEYLYPIMISDVIKKENVLFILTFDEGNKNITDPKFVENKIYTAFYGPMINPTVVNRHYDFYNLLRTIEDIWQLGSLDRNDKTASPIQATIWK
ncbi:MAG: alkaline phosphatase family protein [Legionellales bacterium]|jgi:hypothetical protein